MVWQKSGSAIFSIVALTILGCHSTPLKSPSIVDQESATKWLKNYQQARAHAKDDPAASCKLFHDLAADSRFPARDVANLRALEICGGDETATFDRAQLPPWLNELAVDALLKLSAQRQDKPRELDLAVEKSKQKLPQSEKVKWMLFALERAHDLKDADKEAELQSRLHKLAPRLNPQPEEKHFLAVAGDWRLVREFEKARDYYERVLKSDKYDLDDKIAAHKGIRLTYKNSRQHDKHLEASQRLVQFLSNHLKQEPRSRSIITALYDANMYRGRALWTQGMTSDAHKVFSSLEKKMKGKVSLAELYWIKARMAEEVRDHDKVTEYLDLAMKERITDAEMRDKILWYAAWNERLRKNFSHAIEILQDLEKKTAIDFTRQRTLYWLGRSYLDNKNETEAKTVFSRLAESDPLGYYGLLAHKQLGLPIKLQNSSADSRSLASVEPPQIPMDNAVADWLSLLDEKEALTGFLDMASQNYKKQRDQNDDGWVIIFKYYARAGLYMKLYESLTSLTPERRKNILEHHPELLFPQPWNEDVRAAANQFGIEEELIYAITRQESAFDSRARSLADAFGLMQLLPEVAANLSTKYKIPYTGMDDLYDPKTNFMLGAAHLKELFDRNKGQFILAVASYNASESVIRNWMKSRFRGDATEFIEEIPYEETRAYVRLVMRNLIFYSLLKSKSASIDFPDRVLKLDGA